MVTGTAEGTKQDAGEAQAKPAPGTGLASPEGGVKPEKTYRQSEVDALLGKSGLKLKADNLSLTSERDNLKSQVETMTTEITEVKELFNSLTKDIDAMSSDDPDKDALVKRRKEVEAELKTLKKEVEAELKTLKAERVGVAESKKEIAKFHRDQLVYTVADEFSTADGKDVDFDAFMTAADKFNLNEREGLEALAETMGLKPKAEEHSKPEVPSLVSYSSKNDGGAEDLSNLSPREKIDKGLEAARKKK